MIKTDAILHHLKVLLLQQRREIASCFYFQRFAVLLVLLLFIAPIFGFFPIFKIEQAIIRKEMKKRIKKSLSIKDLQIISISESNKSDIEWTIEGVEFKYKEHFFDVVYSVHNEDIVNYYCINDEKETKLFAHLDVYINLQIANESNGTRGKLIKNLSKLFSTFYYHLHNCLLPDKQGFTLQQFSIFSFNTISCFYDKISPPPEFSN